MKVIGSERWKFTPQGQTQEISGYTVWALEEVPGDRGKGQRPVKLSMNDELYAECVVSANGGIEKFIGRDVEVSYNRYGKVAGIALASK